MRKFNIGFIICGNNITQTDKAIGDKERNLCDCGNLNEPVTEDFKLELDKIAKCTIPANSEYFIEQIQSENQVIDLPKADVYVAIPFAVSDIVYSALYSKNKPVVFYVPPYNKIWSYGAVFFPYFVRDSKKTDSFLNMKNQVYVSKNQDNLKELLAALNVKFRINNTKAFCIGEPMYEPYHSWNWGYSVVRLAQEKFGIEWEHMSSTKFLDIYNNWEKKFEKGIIKEEIKNNFMPEGYDSEQPEKMYNIFGELIKERNADMFTVNCLYSVVHTGCKTTSCYALSKLNDEGIVAACEADITTLMNMAIVTYATDSPAFMLNPYLFPEDNKLFTSHCTSPRKHSLKSDKTDEFNIYAYFEYSYLPAGLQVLKEKERVTVTGLSHDKMDKMIVIRGNIIENTVFPSCRTQVVLNVDGDIKEISEKYEGRHWAMVYGDRSIEIKNANDVLGIETEIF